MTPRLLLKLQGLTPIIGEPGNNTLVGTDDGDYLFGRTGDDELAGGEGDDFLRGGLGDDTLAGGSGNDTLSGGPGDDVLDGGAGDDLLIGGKGADSFFFGTGGAFGHDTVFADAEDAVTIVGPNVRIDSVEGGMFRAVIFDGSGMELGSLTLIAESVASLTITATGSIDSTLEAPIFPALGGGEIVLRGGSAVVLDDAPGVFSRFRQPSEAPFEPRDPISFGLVGFFTTAGSLQTPVLMAAAQSAEEWPLL
jgi:hypothetical protein